jgi:adenylosuccinate synthase
MSKKAYCVTDLGYGDSGKGACVDWLVQNKPVDLIVKFCGGCQCGHNVVNESGKRFTFSQIGAGSNRTPTYLWRNFIVDPIAMLNEAEALQEYLGSSNDPLKNIYIHPDCPIITDNHVRENRSSDNNLEHGSCGRGIGVCRHRSRTKEHETIGTLKALFNKSEREEEFISRINIGNPPEFSTAVFEGSQGILLDESVGFHPHTTWSTVRFDAAHACYRHLGISQHLNIGCTRTYLTRHGNGPLPTETKLGLSDPGNPPNKYQGTMRFGYFDRVLFDYAIKNAGDRIDYLALSHCDETPSKYCDEYIIKNEYVRELPKPSCIEDQAELCEVIKSATPTYKFGNIFSGDNKIPYLYMSFGPRAIDKEQTCDP